eukprot:11218876-Lingulodinium_polyedra.AAC.1
MLDACVCLRLRCVCARASARFDAELMNPLYNELSGAVMRGTAGARVVGCWQTARDLMATCWLAARGLATTRQQLTNTRRQLSNNSPATRQQLATRADTIVDTNNSPTTR